MYGVLRTIELQETVPALPRLGPGQRRLNESRSRGRSHRMTLEQFTAQLNGEYSPVQRTMTLERFSAKLNGEWSPSQMDLEKFTAQLNSEM